MNEKENTIYAKARQIGNQTKHTILKWESTGLLENVDPRNKMNLICLLERQYKFASNLMNSRCWSTNVYGFKKYIEDSFHIVSRVFSEELQFEWITVKDSPLKTYELKTKYNPHTRSKHGEMCCDSYHGYLAIDDWVENTSQVSLRGARLMFIL